MKKILSLLVVLSLMFSLSINVFGFTTYYEYGQGERVKLTDFIDTPGHWAHDQILKWADYDIIQGNNGSFMPNNPIIRGDLAIIIDRMLGLKNTTYNYFSDLYSEDYYRESVLRCVAAGYVNGTGNNQVNPRGNATREEVAVILCRIFNIDTSYSGSTGFKDDSSISSWARSSVYALNRLGYLNGTPDGRVNPKSNITRAEMITLLNNFADTYIPKKDNDSSGTTFVSNFPKNLVTSRNIELKNSTVGRDIYLTQSTTYLNLENTTVRGRIVCFDKVSLSLDGSSVQQVCLNNGKSSITGISELIEEVYVCEYASESTLDTFPNKLVLEPGVRVRVDGVMYENTTTRTKTYSGETLRTEISEEQGYIIGGPKISNGSVKLAYDNTLIIENIRVTEGDNEIREIGIVWLESDKDEEPINPTYKNNDGRKRYNGAYHEPFTFELEDIENYCTYRLYVKDRDGLYAYSSPFTIDAYNFSINLDISEEDYPEKLQADVILRGSNVPKVNSIQVIYAENDLYSEKQNTVALRKYTEQYAENPTDDTRYLRYTGIITSPSERINGETVYTAPTAFGYIITFGDGKIINRFPVLSNVIPEGIDPVNTLIAGSVIFGENRITINDSKVVTNLVSVEEVGIAYKESSSSTMSKPSGNSSGWTRISGGRNLDVKETYTFDTTIPMTDTSLNTFYVPYVKTSNGYFYGDVSKVENNWLGDDNGPRITNPVVIVLNNSTAIVKLNLENSSELSVFENCIISVTQNGVPDSNFDMQTLNDLDYHTYGVGIRDSLFLKFDNLEASSVYNFNIKVVDVLGNSSNVSNFTVNTDNILNLGLEKVSQTETRTQYKLQYPTNDLIGGIVVLNNNGNSVIDSLTGNIEIGSDNIGDYVFVYNVDDLNQSKILLSFSYYINKGTQYQKIYSFDRVFDLN